MAADIVSIGLAVDSRDVKKASAELHKLETQGRKTGKATDKLVSSFKGLLAIGGITAVMTAAINAHREFTKSISELSAITGATGRDLQFYKETARELGATTTFSASQVATAFKLVASAKPDLLESKEALSAVTREVLTLAEASGLQLPDAANALGGALNQFGAGAEEASRFINVLAAGSKFGASEIADTSEAMKNAGAVASSLGLSFESTNAAIQAMASVSIKGAEAGTGLRGVLLKLAQQSNQQFNPEIVGLEQALKNLSDANLTTSERVKLFGQESITAATALINQADSIGELTAKLTGTNVAYDQAMTNTNNLDGDIKSLMSSIESIALTFGDIFDPAIRATVKLLTVLSNSIKSSINFVGDFGKAIGVWFGRLATGVYLIEEIGRQQKTLTERISDATSRLKESQSVNESAKKEYEAVSAAIKELNMRYGEGSPVTAGLIARQQELEQRMIDTAAAAQKQTEELRKLQEQQGAKTEVNDEEEASRKKILLDEQRKLEEEARIAREEEANKQWEKDAEKFDEEIQRDQEFYDRKLAIEKGYLDSAFGAETQMAQDAADFMAAIRAQDYRGALSHGASMLAATASSGKKMFEFSKKVAIANALISGGQAAVDAWKAGLAIGTPFALVFAATFAAASIARTAGMINSIKSQSFGGGGAVSAGGGGAPTLPSTAGGGAALPAEIEATETEPPKELRVMVESDGPHSDGMRKFAQNLAETLKDMGSNTNLVIS